MNTASTPSPRSEEQAALWAARLDGSTLTSDDRNALDAWLAADPSHRALLTSYCQFSADLEQQLPLLAGIRDEVAEAQTAAKTTRSLPWLSRPLWAGAALLAVAVLAAVFLWPGDGSVELRNIATAAAQRQNLTLPDGSRVELNAQTALAVDFTAAARRVRLAGGEAFFQVSRDPARPFYVETPAGSVRVTGTQFNVRSESPGALEVTVLEGSVQVQPGGAAVRDLTHGDRLWREADTVTVTSLSDGKLRDALAWRQGRIVFEGTPLRDALARFARYHGKTITASDAAAAKRVGGSHSLDDLNGFLTSIEAFLPVRVQPGLDGSYRVEAVDPAAQP